jgi:poly(beta-D-mannuronate) lyase
MVGKTLCVACLGLLTGAAFAAEHAVASADQISRVAGQLQPGDVVVLKDGQWNDQSIVLNAKGSEQRPITFRAATPGGAVITGRSSIVIEGEHLVLSGIWLKSGAGKGDGIKIAGGHNRLTESAVTGGEYKFLAHMFGVENRLDHCYLADKTTESPTLQIEVDKETPNRHRIDHNHFGPRPPLGKNGGETMRVGYSHQSMFSSGTVVEENLFDRCDGELEIISSKSCDNVYRNNTFLDCAGTLTLRHGNRCRVEANYFIAHHKKGSGGVRVIGEDHLVANNYIDGVEMGGVWITSGIPDSPLNGYYRADRCVIAFNTIVDSRGPCIQLDAGFGSSNRSLRPRNITIANNLISPGDGGTVLKGTEGEGFKWQANLASVQQAGIRAADLKLERANDGLLHPAADSAARSAAEGDFATIKTDIDGQTRATRSDVGCDQDSSAPATNRPLTAKDVGPTWMERIAPRQ